MDEATSRRVKLLRFPLILLVLYIHSFIAPVTFGRQHVLVAPAPWLVAVSTAWSDGFARTAVPLFFLMSGYLFFLGFDGNWTTWRAKLSRRGHTLLVPYLFWNGLMFALIAVAQAMPATAGYFNAGNTRIADAGPFELADRVLGITHYPLAYPFWFIRDLMMMVLLTPLIHWSIARSGLLLPLVLWLWWSLALPFLPVPAIEGLAWFVIGAWIGLRGAPLFPQAALLTWLVPTYAVLLAADVMQRLALPGARWFYAAAVTLGVVTTLALTSWAERHARLSAALIALSSASFFVFAAHEPLMTAVRKLLYRFIPASQAFMLTTYVLLPLGVAAVLTIVYFALRRVAPSFTALVGGGR